MPTSAQASAALAELLPPQIASAELHGVGDPESLMAAERELMLRAAPKRAREFAAGRACARAALARLGVRDYPLRTLDNRCPRWPRGLCGSITHTDGYAAAAVARSAEIRAIGIDAEVLGQVPDEIWEDVFLPAERRFLKSLAEDESARVATLLFSAREAFYKLQFTLTGQWLEFQDVAIDLAGWDLGAGSYAVRPARALTLFEQLPWPLTGCFRFDGRLAITAMSIPAQSVTGAF